jgi:GH25 family lysozyme M1 (1,4-beta-N-acetylmuramidase)
MMLKKLLLCTGLAALSFHAGAQVLLGIDVSTYQGNITWSSVKNNSAKKFAWAKASEGVNLTDNQFVNNEVNGTAAGVVMGAYHFSRPESNSAVSEANYFVSVAGAYIKAGRLPPALDLEDPGGSSPALTSYFTSAALTSWVQTWMTTVQNATGITPVLYTSGGIANYLGSSLHVYKLWTADPDGSATATPSATYLGTWPTWTFKQYSWTGAISGISGNVDMDSFNGDTAAFNNIVHPVPPVCHTWYAALPYSTSFEVPWITDSCVNVSARLPDRFWKSSNGGTTPNGDDMWHRDDYAGGDWSAPTSGAYTPTASDRSYSARFHNAPPPAGSTGLLDLYVNFSGAGAKTISFDYIHNEVSPAPFSFDVLLSTDGGSTFPTTLLTIPGATQAAAWTHQSVSINISSATSVIRFRVTDKGNADVGIDNLVVSNNPLGISEEVMKTAVTLYPNPNNGSFTLSVSGFIKEPLRLEIYDALGRQVYNELYRADAAQINLEDQANGIYFYRVMTASGDKLMAGGKMILKH